MLVYFGAQYGEGAIAAFPGDDGKRRYRAPEAIVDILETLAMAAIMAAIGVFGGAPTGLVGRLFDAGNDADHWLWMALAFALPPIARGAQIGRAACRERVCQYVVISVVAGSLKKKTKNNNNSP